jgi:hypothetical protein
MRHDVRKLLAARRVMMFMRGPGPRYDNTVTCGDEVKALKFPGCLCPSHKKSSQVRFRLGHGDWKVE